MQTSLGSNVHLSPVVKGNHNPLDTENYTTNTQEVKPRYRVKNPYRRLLFALILQALMEREPAYCLSEGNGKTKQSISLDAHAWVAGPRFEQYCRLLGLTPKRMRLLTPAQGKQALHEVMNNEAFVWLAKKRNGKRWGHA